MSSGNRGSGCSQNVGCIMIVLGIILAFLIPVTFGVSAVLGAPLFWIGAKMMSDGARKAGGEQISCCGCCIPGALVTIIVLTLIHTNFLR